MINTPLLEATMTAIRDYPELHEQSSWYTETECGTAMCFAGWACKLSGMEQIMPGTFSNLVRTPWGDMTAREAAQRVLGLTHEQQETLFHGGNKSSMLELMVKDLMNSGDIKGGWDYYNDLVS